MAVAQEYEHRFLINEEVEVIGHGYGSLESFYTARITADQVDNKYMVEYNTVYTGQGTHRYRKLVHKAYIRPKPYQIHIQKYPPGAKVDVYMMGGWWTGRITNYDDDTRLYNINFTHYAGNYTYHSTEIRVYQKWEPTDNSWKHCLRKIYELPFRLNDEVEIIGHEDGMMDSFFIAKIVSGKVNNEYEVEYKTLAAEQGNQKHREIVHNRFIRPKAHPAYIYIYPLGAKVDAYSNGAWWTGVITRYDHATRKYEVYLPSYNETDSYHISDIRIHMIWNLVNNSWKHSIGRI